MSSPSVPLTEIANNVAAVTGSRSGNDVENEKTSSDDRAVETAAKKSTKATNEEEEEDDDDMEYAYYDHSISLKTLAEIEEEKKTAITNLSDVCFELENLSTPGSACTGDEAPGLPALPGLNVKGVGTVPLPLTQDIASKLKSVAKPVPHDHDMESVEDKTSGFQIEVDQVTLQNKAWTTALGDIVSTAATALGTDPSLIKPELYKLLMFESGGLSYEHKATIKPDKKFALLAVQLPSTFVGGKFVVTTRNKKSRTFTMDMPDSAPYQCHYVAHYADCQHEISPIESGYRLMLIYSLCFTGERNDIPRFQKIINEEEGVIWAMNRLDRQSSLFFVPLAQKYSMWDFATSGDAAFEGSDRKLAKTLSQASGWKVLMGFLERIDFEYRHDDDDFGYEFEAADGSADEVEKGDPKFIYMYNQDGSDASRHIPWISNQMDLRSCEDDGMLLAMDEKVEQIWGTGAVRNVEYDDKEGASREVHYVTCVLVAFSIERAFEFVCRSDFCLAVNEVIENPSLLVDRMLAYIRNNRQTITSNDFIDLYDVIREDDSFEDPYWDRMKVLVDSLDSTEVPNGKVADLFASLAKVHGWNGKMTPIHTYFTRLAEMNTPSTFSDFFRLIDVLLLMDAAKEDDDIFRPIVKSAIDRFEICSYLKADWNPPRIGEKLIALCNEYGCEKIGSIAKPCIVRTLNKNLQNATHLADILSMLRNLTDRGFAADMEDTIQKNVLSAFLSLVEGGSAEHSYSSHVHHTSIYRSVWCAPNVEILAQELISRGTPTEFQRILAWIKNATPRNLSAAQSVFENIKTRNVTLHPDAWGQCIKAINDRIKALSIQDLQKRENELLQATKEGEPVFSWSMPDARTGNPAVDSFLKSPNEGPKTIIVGGGINNARHLESGNRYGQYGYSMTNKEHIANGYSAKIQAAKGSGKKASVTVTKTKQWYDARVEEYKNNMMELSDVRNKLSQFGAKPARHVREPVAKRPKTDSGNARN